MLPLNITTPEETEETAAASATEDGVSRLPPHREEESCLNSLKDNTVQWKQPASSCVQPASLSPSLQYNWFVHFLLFMAHLVRNYNPLWVRVLETPGSSLEPGSHLINLHL